ncbi:MAG: hypothetical protein WCQ95_04740 [Bacteroidota bacterium]
MKLKKFILLSLLLFTICCSACKTKKSRYEHCPTFGKNAMNIEKVHARI